MYSFKKTCSLLSLILFILLLSLFTTIFIILLIGLESFSEKVLSSLIIGNACFELNLYRVFVLLSSCSFSIIVLLHSNILLGEIF